VHVRYVFDDSDVVYAYCFEGSGAFCCDNPTKSVSQLYRSPASAFYSARESQNDPLVEDFKRRLTNFANDPTCDFNHKQLSRRGAQEIEVVPSNLSLSQPNDPEITSLDKFDFAVLLQQLSQIFRGRGQTNQQNLMVSQFDMLYGDRLGLHSSDVETYYDDWCVV